MNDLGELAAPTIYNGVMYVINGKWTFAIDVETGRQIWRTPVELEPGAQRVADHARRAGHLQRQAVSRHDRQPPGRARHEDRQAGLEPEVRRLQGRLLRDRRADRRQRRGHLRNGRRRVHDARVPRRLGSRDRARSCGGVTRFRRQASLDRRPGRRTATRGSTAAAPTWRSGSYDPELDLVYWGTGNAEPYDPRPRGALDSLYTSSVLAIRPKTGEIACYFQYTPNDVYDVDGIDEHVLADIRIDGQLRKVMIQANKNGFLYVLDRTNCKLIAAHPYTKVNWATHVDLATGRPVLTDLYKRFLAGEEVADLSVARHQRRADRVQSEHRPGLREHVGHAAHPEARARRSRRCSGTNSTGVIGSEPDVQARRRGRSLRRDRSADRREEMGGAADRHAELGRDAGHWRRPGVHRQADRRVRRARRGDRRDAVAVQDRVEHQRHGDHVYAQGPAVRHGRVRAAAVGWPGVSRRTRCRPAGRSGRSRCFRNRRLR